jgi:hypothetical protein
MGSSMGIFKNILNEASFNKKHFPKQADGFGSGEGTQYTPTSATDDRFLNGFPISKNTKLVTIGGEVIKSLEKDTPVYFVFPFPPLIKVGGSTYAAVSLIKSNATPDGYVKIAHISKPAGKSQQRVKAGSSSQDLINQKLKEQADLNKVSYKFISTAKAASTRPDLVVEYDGKRVQFEIKGMSKQFNSVITLFDASMNRSVKHPLAEKLVPLVLRSAQITLTKDPKSGKKLTRQMSFPLQSVLPKNIGTMAGIIDFYREYSNDSTIGFPGDKGTSKSGKLPSDFKFYNKSVLNSTLLRKIIIDHFAEGGDNYFALHSRSLNAVKMYYTGHGENVLGLEELPQLSFFGFMTYGGVSSGRMRSGIKVKFDI